MAHSFLILSEDIKGLPFLRTLKEAGCKTFVVTRQKSKDIGWPMEHIDELFVRPGSHNDKPHDKQELVAGTAYIMREHGIDRIVALDDFDVEDAALLREEFRVPGMGQTTARYFRDKLAMRLRAQKHGIPAPAFSGMFRREDVASFCESNPGPYVVKPRSEASAAGISKVGSREEALAVYDRLGEQAYRYLIECFAPGQVFHVDAVIRETEMQFVRSSAYVDPPLSIVQGGGTFQTRTLDLEGEDHAELQALTDRVMKVFGMRFSASHTEGIRNAAGEFLFLETSSRVGGAHIADMLREASGVDLWAEWAKLELADLREEDYRKPEDRGGYGAITIRTIGEEWATLEGVDLGVSQRMIPKRWHAAGLMWDGDLGKVAAAQERLYGVLRERYG